MQLYSNSLKQSFDFVTFEKEENGKVVKIITHDSLEDVIHNQIENIDYETIVVSSETDHSVAYCTMSKDNRKVVAYGETVPATLDNEIARNHPTLIATQRAFDRAAIRFLALPGKVFSNSEIPIPTEIIAKLDDEVETATPVATASVETAGIVSSVIVSEDDSDDGMMISDEIIVDDDDEFAEINISENVVTETPANEITDELNITDDTLPFDFEEKKDTLEEVGSYVITMNGKYSSANKTIKEIYDENPGWIDFVVNKFKAYNDVAKRDQEQVIKFANLLKEQNK